MSSIFRLVNPYIVGSINNDYKTSSPEHAIKHFWEKLSKYIGNIVPSFVMSIKNLGTGIIHSYEINEKQTGGKTAQFDIFPYDGIKNEKIPKFNKRLNALIRKQTGGKHRRKHRHDDDNDSSSSSSSDDFYKHLREYNKYKQMNAIYPISYYYYDPSIYNITGTYVPSFIKLPYSSYSPQIFVTSY